ncbi:hypothetical protein UPYG_G00217070 [Umbra pygmaea]|uniref:Rab-GAP TBC domain-containing protein n=1 Tax=Umbra pygmaea TaxID=75934 RepID=A0ABD0WR64_UMBPY
MHILTLVSNKHPTQRGDNSKCKMQNALGGEESSESDKGSEIGIPPPTTETDRFGFILGNGSTAGGVRTEGPSPELVRQREMKWINIISQWDQVVLKKSSKVKEQCHKGIPASLRAKCWPLLCGASDRMKCQKDLYQTLDSGSALQSWVEIIERDLDRQFPFHEMFLSRDGHGQRGLFRVLKAFTQLKPEEGYCQAQGPVAAVLLMNMPTEEAFWCLVQISEQYLPGYYSPLLEGVLFDAAILSWVLKKLCPAAYKHLQRHGVEPLMFATDWLMCLFTRHLPFNTLLRVWDLFFCYGVRVLFQVAVVLVRRALGRGEQREECEGQMETLEKLRGVKEQVPQDDDTFIAEVCSVTLSKKELNKQTEKELEKWRKERPASTFDPRGRCHGYRTVLARAREKEEINRKERAKGNLSIPRSSSTLSLSPSLLHKRRKRGSKSDTSEWDGGGRASSEVPGDAWGMQSKGLNLWRGSGVPPLPEDRAQVKPSQPSELREPWEGSHASGSVSCQRQGEEQGLTRQGQTRQGPEEHTHFTAQETSHSQHHKDTQEVLTHNQAPVRANRPSEPVVTETTSATETSRGETATHTDIEPHTDARAQDSTPTERHTDDGVQVHTSVEKDENMITNNNAAMETRLNTETYKVVNIDTETDTQHETGKDTETGTHEGTQDKSGSEKEAETETQGEHESAFHKGSEAGVEAKQ